jgi:hypothetical protein
MLATGLYLNTAPLQRTNPGNTGSLCVARQPGAIPAEHLYERPTFRQSDLTSDRLALPKVLPPVGTSILPHEGKK